MNLQLPYNSLKDQKPFCGQYFLPKTHNKIVHTNISMRQAHVHTQNLNVFVVFTHCFTHTPAVLFAFQQRLFSYTLDVLYPLYELRTK